jgi:hypothetical protein
VLLGGQAGQLSARVITGLMEWSGREINDHYYAVDVEGAGAVVWASDGPVPRCGSTSPPGSLGGPSITAAIEILDCSTIAGGDSRQLWDAAHVAILRRVSLTRITFRQYR